MATIADATTTACQRHRKSGSPALLVKRPVARTDSVKGAFSGGVEHAGAKQVEVGPAVHGFSRASGSIA